MRSSSSDAAQNLLPAGDMTAQSGNQTRPLSARDIARPLLLVGVLLAAGAASGCAEAVDPPPPCPDCLSLEKSRYTPGEGVTVHWRIPNPRPTDWIF